MEIKEETFQALLRNLEKKGLFSKRELEIIDWYLNEYKQEEGVDKEADRLRRKVSKLLKRK